MMTSVEGMYGGLAALGETLQVERVGPMHQAGSDSLLTAQTYFALIKKHLGPVLDDKKYKIQLPTYLLPFYRLMRIFLSLGSEVNCLD
jgi:hypothetical protein